MRRWPLLVALALVLDARPLAQGRTDDAPLAAEAYTWSAPGGGPTGAGASATPVPRGPVTEAWSRDFDGELVSEPLVSGERILVQLDVGDERHELVVVERETGEPVGRPYPVHSVRPDATLDGDLVVACTADDRLSFLRLGRDGLSLLGTKLIEGGVRHPVLVDEGVLATAGDELHLLSRGVGRGTTLWRAEVAPLGPAAVQGGSVWVAARSTAVPKGIAVAHVALDDGSVRSTPTIAADPRGLSNLAIRTGLLPGTFTLSASRPVPWVEGLPRRAAVMGRNIPQQGQFEFPVLGPQLEHAPAATRRGYVGQLHTMGGDRKLVEVERPFGEQGVILGSEEVHPEVLGQPRPTVAGDVLLLGGAAVDLESGRYLWKTALEPVRAPVPARARVLYVTEGGRRLTALGPAGAAAPRSVAVGATSAEEPLRVVTRAGELVEAAIVLGAEGPRPAASDDDGDAAQQALEGALAVVDGEGALRWAAGPEAACLASAVVSASERAVRYVDLAGEARKANDAALLSELIEAAVVLGAPERDVARASKTLESLEKRPRKVKIDKVAELREAQFAVAASRPDVPWRWSAAFEGSDDPASLEVRLALLEETLARSVRHAGASGAVRALLPEGVEPREPFAPLEWLEFVRAASRSPVQLVEPPEAETADLSFAELQLGRAQHTWRKDLIGLESDDLVILSTPDRPGAIARCLSLASLTCDALEELFAPYGREERPDRKLVVFLYPSRDEFKKMSAKVGIPPGTLRWAGGFYSPSENVSRLFIPDPNNAVPGEEPLEETLRTIVHEITHHWLQMRCPMWSSQELRQRSPLQQGYWIVEGFAGFVEEWRFDQVTRSWTELDARAWRIDKTAHSRDGARLDWKVVYEISQMGFHRNRFEGQVPIESAWALGTHHVVDARSMYYCQAAATCAYLFHADGGQRRPALLEYLKSFYTGEGELDVEQAFGLAPDELGKRVHAFARDVTYQRYVLSDDR